MELKDTDFKACARKLMAERRGAQDPEVAKRRSRLAQEFVLRSPLWREARNVGLYMPIRGEMGTDMLLNVALTTGKTVFLPRVEGPQIMRFYLCASSQALRPGIWGIMEPPSGSPEAGQLDLVLAPGLAFDRTGTRLGYGGGYYDRYLRNNPGMAAKALGFGFSFQIVPQLPRTAFDVPVAGLCTEEGLQWI